MKSPCNTMIPAPYHINAILVEWFINCLKICLCFIIRSNILPRIALILSWWPDPCICHYKELDMIDICFNKAEPQATHHAKPWPSCEERSVKTLFHVWVCQLAVKAMLSLMSIGACWQWIFTTMSCYTEKLRIYDF